MSNWRDDFFQNLRDLGLATRHYDTTSYKRMPTVAKDLHAELSKLDHNNFKGWRNVTLLDLANAFAKANPGMRILDRHHEVED